MGFDDSRKMSGSYVAEVLRAERVSPHMQRVTFGGDDLKRLPARGFDHWFRCFLPNPDGTTDFDAVPESFGIGGYLRYLVTKSGTRPPFRNYTARFLRPEVGELDVDFVAHGDAGVAGPWAQRARAGERVVFLDQGRGFDPLPNTDFTLLAGDESALPAILGILADLPRDAKGLAIIEIPETADRQEAGAPDGVEVRWLPRADPHDRPGVLVLESVEVFEPAAPASLQAYVVGEQALAAGGRRALLAAGVPKQRVAFVGYWKIGRAG